MTSTLGCVGLAATSSDGLDALVGEVFALATPMGSGEGFDHYRWTDPSGARLTLLAQDHRLAYVLPSYAGDPGVRLGDLSRLAPELAGADVLDADGEVATRMAVEVEQMQFLPADPVSGSAAVTAFGLDVRVHADEAAYDASSDSLLDPESADEPRPDAMSDLVRWPLRKGAESFFPLGLFGDAEEAKPHALLSGTVTAAATHTVALTGQTFHVARTALLGMELGVCLAGTDHPGPPPVGGIVTGTVYLVASLDQLWPPMPTPSSVPSTAAPTRRRRWFGRG